MELNNEVENIVRKRIEMAFGGQKMPCAVGLSAGPQRRLRALLRQATGCLPEQLIRAVKLLDGLASSTGSGQGSTWTEQ